jgi:hypothetical protein
MSDSPILYTALEDGAMIPASPFWQKKAEERFKPGDRVLLEQHEERSAKSHDHLFAFLHDAFLNLPDNLRAEYPSEQHLRKKLLIRAGYCHERDVICETKAEAQRVAVLVPSLDTYAIAIPKGNVCKIYTAESQSIRSMGKKRFQESKDAILTALASLLGTSPLSLERNVAA